MIALLLGFYISRSDTSNNLKTTLSSDNAHEKIDELDKQENRKQSFINSNSTEFSYAKLGSKVKEFHVGEKLEIDGGPYFFTKNKAMLSYDYDDKLSYEKQGFDQKITAISFHCSNVLFPKSEGLASIDNISCYTELTSIDNNAWTKSCYVYSFGDYSKPFDLLFTKNNAYVEVKFDNSNSPKIDEIGLYLDKTRFDKGYRSCEEAQKLKKKAIQNGFKSLGAMMSK